MQIESASLDQSISHGRDCSGGLDNHFVTGFSSKKSHNFDKPDFDFYLFFLGCKPHKAICTEFSLKHSNQIKLRYFLVN